MSIEQQLRDHLRAKAELVEVPDQPFTATSSRRPRPRLTGVAVAAAVVVLVGGFAYLVGRTSTPVTDDAVAATGILPEDAIRPPGIVGDTFLSWSRVELPAGVDRITGVAATDGGYLAIGGAPSGSTIVTSTPVVLESADGATWTESALIPPVAENAGLIAIGAQSDHVVIAALEAQDQPPVRPAFLSGIDTRAVLYVYDGTDWSRIALEEIDAAAGYRYVTPNIYVHDVAIADGTAVAVGSAFWEPDLVGIAEFAFGTAVDAGDIIGWGFDGNSVQLMGPGNTTIADVRLSDLGVTEDEQELLRGGMGQQRIWVSTDLETFDPVEVEGMPAEVFRVGTGVLADGRLYLDAQGHHGSAIWVLPDGRSWEALLDWTSPGGSVARYDDQWLQAVDGFPRAKVRASAEGETWSDASPQDLFPDDGRQWSFGQLRTSEIGVVATAFGFSGVMTSTSGSPATEVTKDGYRIVIRPDTGITTVSRDGETLLSILDYGTDSDMSRYNQAAGTVEFLDPATGDVLVTLTFEEIDAAERSVYETEGPSDEAAAVVYSPDGIEWSFQLPEEAIGVALGGGGMELLVVDDDLVIGSTRTGVWLGTFGG
jgi:hypothetical protein